MKSRPTSISQYQNSHLASNLCARLKFLTILATMAGLCGLSHGEVTVTATETEGNVVFSWTGSLDMTGATEQGLFGGFQAYVSGITPTVSLYGAGSSTQDWAATGPGSNTVGDSTFTPATASSGTYAFGLWSDTTVKLQAGYVSGSEISGTSTYNDQTFVTMGLYPGSYVWTITGSNDTVTLNVGFLPPTVVVSKPSKRENARDRNRNRDRHRRPTTRNNRAPRWVVR